MKPEIQPPPVLPDFVGAIAAASERQQVRLYAAIATVATIVAEALKRPGTTSFSVRDIRSSGLTGPGLLARIAWLARDPKLILRTRNLVALSHISLASLLCGWLASPGLGVSALFVPPLQKNIAEPLAFAWFKEIVERQGGRAEMLPKGGSGSCFLAYHGRLVWRQKKKQTHRHGSRSMDFKAKIGGVTLFASVKYTQGFGGSQDNQAMELEHFLELASHNQDPWYRFLALADGDYYEVDTGAGNWWNRQSAAMESYSKVGVASCRTLEEVVRGLVNASVPPEYTGQGNLDWEGEQKDDLDRIVQYLDS